jgi:hypothetical protein
MFGREQVHSATPGAGDSCTQCHQPHYPDAGACQDCHQKPAVFHHGIGPLVGSVLTVQADEEAVAYGSSVTLRGRLTGSGMARAGETVVIQAKPGSAAAFEALGSVVTGADGGFELPVSPVKTTTYRAIWRGSGTSTTAQAPAVATVSLGVRLRVSLRLNSASLIALGRRVAVAGSIQPASAALGTGASGGPVKVTVLKARYSRTQRALVWARVASTLVKLDAQARFSWSWSPKSPGKYRVQATAKPGADFLTGKSPVRSFRVR